MSEQAAHWLVEAFETGNPLGPLPPGVAPASLAAGEAVAALVLEQLGLVPCGIRLVAADGVWLAGPMLEGRLLPNGAGLPLAALRHARATAALVAVLAEALTPDSKGLPGFAAVHPAIDVAGSRFRDPPKDLAVLAADLGGLGHVVAGRGGRLPEGDVAMSLAEARRRPRGVPVDLRAALLRAADAARRLGGLPAGALLVVAGLSPPVVPELGLRLAAGFAGLGRATLSFA